MTTFRWAILGTGAVSRKFVLGLRSSAFDVRVTVVASRNRAHAEVFGRNFGVPYVAESYVAACEHSEVDAVYIATPPTVHEAQALSAVSAGKAVLVEKPFATDAASAKRIIDAARSADVFCMEGMWTRFLPLTRHLKAMVEKKEVGEIRAFCGSYSQADQPSAKKNIFNASLGGGALMHRGIYPLSMACHLMGSVVEARAVAAFGETGVDEDTTVVCRHEKGISTIQTSLRTTAANDCRVMGTKGTIHVEGPIYRPFRLRYVPVRAAGIAGPGNLRKESLKESHLAQGVRQRTEWVLNRLRGRSGQTVIKHYAGNGYHYEADEVMRSLREGRTESETMPLADSLMVMEALDKARAVWR